jgi:hypothetical protein
MQGQVPAAQGVQSPGQVDDKDHRAPRTSKKAKFETEDETTEEM